MIKRLINKINRIYRMKIRHMTLMQIRINEYRKAGIKIGDGCIFCSELPTGRDCSQLSFGDNCLVAGGVRFLMHDAAPTVVSNSYTDILGGGVHRKQCFYRSGFNSNAWSNLV